MRRLPILVLLASLVMPFGCSRTPYSGLVVREARAEEERDALIANVVLPCHPLTLQEVIDTAMTYNLETKLHQFEEEVLSDAVAAQKLKVLPSLQASFQQNDRSNINATQSLDVTNGTFADFSTSESRKNDRWDVTATLNVLDFSINYFRARQEGDRAAQVRLRHIRAAQNLILNVYRAYFRALIAQHAKTSASEVLNTLEERQVTLKKQIADQIVPKIRGLQREGQILEWQVRLAAFENEYESAMTELSSLMGVPPGTYFTIADVRLMEDLPELDIERAENTALLYRPELMEQDLQQKISADEVKASLVKLFPGVSLFGGYHHLDDIFFLFRDWEDVGFKTAIDLLSLPSNWYTYRSNTKSLAVDRQKRLVLSMGVLTQVNLAYIQILDQASQYKIAKELYQSKKQALETSMKLHAGGKIGIDDLVTYRTEMVFAEVNQIRAYGNLQVALEQIGNVTGQPLSYTLQVSNYNSLRQPLTSDKYAWERTPVSRRPQETVEVAKTLSDDPWWSDLVFPHGVVTDWQNTGAVGVPVAVGQHLTTPIYNATLTHGYAGAAHLEPIALNTPTTAGITDNSDLPITLEEIAEVTPIIPKAPNCALTFEIEEAPFDIKME